MKHEANGQDVVTAPQSTPEVPMPEAEEKLAPVQAYPRNRKAATVPWDVHMRAYEVYREVHGKQEALITSHCRGGFGSGELIAFLYARSFPPHEWRWRVDEAFKGMNV